MSIESLARTSEEQALAASVRSLLRTHSPSTEVRRLRDATGEHGHNSPLWVQLVELGYSSLAYSETVGGAGAGMRPLGEVVRELGRSLANTPLLSQVLAVTCLEHSPAPAHRALAQHILEGTDIITLAFQEGARRGSNINTRLLRSWDQSDVYELTGRKEFVLDGEAADTFVVTACLEDHPDAVGLVLVPSEAAGVRRSSGRLLDGRPVSTVEFDRVVLNSNAVLLSGTGAELALDHALRRGAAMLAAEMAGGAEAALELTVRHLKDRVQFGVPLGSFQALQHRAARMLVAVESSIALSRAAMSALDTDADDADALVSSAFVYNDDAFRLVTAEGAQMHGGLGMTEEVDIGLYLKRALVTSSLLGDRFFHCDRVAMANGL
jgi:alkylation response protein AidB-like acyl-CoA dehydrogenase